MHFAKINVALNLNGMGKEYNTCTEILFRLTI